MRLKITVDGQAYAVDVEVLEDEEGLEPQRSRSDHTGAQNFSHPPSLGGTWDEAGSVCLSPVLGLVIKVDATAGQAVEAGELLMVLEAMKMETNVTAPHAGTVKSVQVTEGDSVKINQVLLELK